MNVVNIVNLGSKSLDCLTLMVFSGLHFTITVTSVQLLSVWTVKVQFGSLTSVFSHGLFLCCFIAVSLLWDHWDFMSLHTAFYFQSLKTLYCCFFFYLVQMPKSPVQFTYVLVHMSSFPCFLIYPLQTLNASGPLGAEGAHGLWTGTAPNVCGFQWVLQRPCIMFLLVLCQVPFLKPTAYPILFHTFTTFFMASPTLATCY